MLVVQKTGQIRIVTTATGAIAPTPFLDVSGQIATDGQRGLLGLALAPDFAASGTAFIFMANVAGDIEIRRYTTVAGNRDRLDPATADTIMRIPHAASNINYGGWIGFGPYGFLYITVGDANDCAGPQNFTSIRNCNARRYDRLLGKVLRIDVNTDAFPADPERDYAIPPGNRYASEMLLFGVRNPYRASFNMRTNEMWFGDIGQDLEEEINRIFIPNQYPGNNPEAVMDFDWPYKEGSRVRLFDSGALLGTSGNPRTVYSHGVGVAGRRAVVGGYFYRGPVESLQTVYIFGDYVTGQVFSHRQGEAIRDRTTEFVPNAGTINTISSFGEDQAGNVYVVDLDGELFLIEPA